MDLRSLIFRFRFDGDKAKIEEFDGATSRLKESAEKAAKSLKGMEKSFGKVGKNLMTKVTLPIVGAATAGTKMALDLEHNIKKVSTLADSEILPVSKIQEEVRAISDASGIAQTEIADAAYSALSAGVDSANVMEFVRSGIDLTRAGFTDMETAIDATTTVLNAYGDNAYEVSKIHDIFVQTQDKGKISVDELGKNIGRVIPTASSLGVNLDQLGASYAILTAKGQNAQLATTNLNAMLAEMGSTGSKVDEALREMSGKSFAQLTEEGKSVGEVLGMLDEYAKANNLSLKDMFGSMNAGSAAVTLLSDGVEGYNAMLKEMDGATGKTAENAATMEDGWFKINKAMTQVKNTLIDAGAVLAPYIEMAATKVSELTERFNGLDEGTKSNIMKFLGLAVATGPVILGASKIIGVVGSVIGIGGKLIGGISTVTGVLGGPLTLALVGAVAAGIVLYKNWDKIKEGAKKAWEATTKIVEGAVSKIKEFWEGLKKFLKNPIKGVVNIFRRDKGAKADVDGSHATGLDDIPKDNYLANLHKGEMVLTKSTAERFRDLGGTKDRIPEVLTRDMITNKNISNIQNIDKSNTVSNLIKNFTNNKTFNNYMETETYNNYKTGTTSKAEEPKRLPEIYFKPIYNIEINGNVTEEEVNNLTDKIDERTRKIINELFHELGLKMA